MSVAKDEASKAMNLHQCSAADLNGYYIYIVGLSDKESSYNSVKMAQKSCFLDDITRESLGLKYLFLFFL